MKRALPFILLGLGAVFLVLGIFGDEVKIVLTRAANICLECIGMAKKTIRNRFRGYVQVVWTLFSNGYLLGFVNGHIWQGKSKSICVPGLNCYSCPGAWGACPIGSLQASLLPAT
jgi:hypothetical protein